MNVKRAVRERSIPLEPSECPRVKVGDLVLCFQVTFSFFFFFLHYTSPISCTTRIQSWVSACK